MEQILSEVQRLSTSKVLVHSDEAVLHVVSLINNLIKSSTQSVNFSSFYDLVTINNGNLSVQSSVSLARSLFSLFSLTTNSNPNSICLEFAKKCTASSSIVAGELIRLFPKGSVTSIAELFSLFHRCLGEYKFHSLFALKHLVKSCSPNPYLSQIFSIISESVKSPPEAVQMISLQIMRAIIKQNQTYVPKCFPILPICLQKTQTPFVRSETINLVALCALHSDDPFPILCQFETHISQIFSRFFEISPVDFLIKKANQIVDIIIKNDPSLITVFTPYLFKALKQKLFDLYIESSPSPSHVTVLNSLVSDNFDLVQLSKYAVKANGPESFFQSLPQNIANAVFVDSVNEKLSLPVISILSKYPELANSFNFADLLSRDRSDYVWEILAVIPNLPPSISQYMKTPSQGLAKFLVQHPEFQDNSSVFKAVVPDLAKLDTEYLISLAQLVPKIGDFQIFADFFLSKVYEHSPGRSFYTGQINRSVTTGDSLLLLHTKPDQTLPHQKLTQVIITNFPDMFNQCHPDYQQATIKTLLAAQTNLAITHSILLSLVKNERSRRALPQSFVGVLLKSLTGNDFLRLQITSEAISLMIKSTPNFLDALFKFLDLNKRVVSCILMSAVLCHIKLSKSYLSRCMLMIDERVLSATSTPFALHALLSLLEKYPQESNEMGIDIHYLSLVIKLLQNPTSLHPVVLQMLADVFIHLLPTLSADQWIGSIEAVLASIGSTPIPFAKKVYIDCVMAVYSKHLNIVDFSFNFEKKSPAYLKKLALSAQIKSQTGDISCLKQFLFFANDFQIDQILSITKTIKHKELADFCLLTFTKQKIPDMDIEPNEKATLSLLLLLGHLLHHPDCVHQVLVSLLSALSFDSQIVKNRTYTTLEVFVDTVSVDVLNHYKSEFTQTVEYATKIKEGSHFVLLYLKKTRNLMDSIYNIDDLDNLPLAAAIGSITTEATKAANQFVSIFMPKFEEILLHVMKVVYKRANTIELKDYEQFYPDLTSAYVWMSTIQQPKIPHDVLFSFFGLELKEIGFRRTGAVNGISALLRFNQDLDSGLVHTVISAALQDKTSAPIFAVLARKGKCWPEITVFVLDGYADTPTIFDLIEHYDSKMLASISKKLSHSIIKKSAKERDALFSLLLAKSNLAAFVLPDVLVEEDLMNFDLLTQCFKLGCVCSSNVAKFVEQHFLDGGLECIAEVILGNREVGLDLFARVGANCAFSCLKNGVGDAEKLLRFIQLGLTQIPKNDQLSLLVLNLVLDLCIKRIAIHCCVDLFKSVDSTVLEAFWNSTDENKKELCVCALK